MAYRFTEMKKRDIQKETAYILFMMVSSMFNKCICMNPVIQNRMYLYYREMPVSKQIQAEEKVLRVLDRTLHMMEETFAGMNAEVRFDMEDKTGYVIRFYTGFEEIRITVAKNGEYDIDLLT